MASSPCPRSWGPVSQGGLDARSSIRRRDGHVVATPPSGSTYSTTGLLKLEQQLIDEAAESSAAGLGVASAEQVEEALAHRPTIGDEQAAMVRRLTTSGAGVDVVAAAAGTGKTFGLDAARDAWQRSGYCVVGASLAAEAAHEANRCRHPL